MTSMTIEQAQERARAYGTGQLPIVHLPPAVPHKTRSGICDYCNIMRPVVDYTKNGLFEVCWRCACNLKDTIGDDWETKVNTRLETNKKNRAQKDALKATKKKGVKHAELK